MSQTKKGRKEVAVQFPSDTAPVFCNVFGASQIDNAVVLDFGFVNPAVFKILEKGNADSPDVVEAVQVCKVSVPVNRIEQIIQTLQQIQQEVTK